MGLLSGDLAGVFAAAFAPLYLEANLYRATVTGDGQGGGTESFAAAEPVKAQLDATTQAMQASLGYVDTDQRILVLADGVATITADDEIEVGGFRWQIASVSQDPCGAYYELRGRRAGSAGS